MKVETAQVYVTKSGKRFLDSAEAADVDRHERLAALVEQHVVYTDCSETVISFLEEHWKEVKEILEDF